MKMLLLFIATCCTCCLQLQGQNLIIKGKIKCLNPSPNSTRGAENIVVVPAFQPSLATLTSSRPMGYFEVNTGLPLARLQDKQVTMYVISRCSNCEATSKRVFISEDQDRQNRADNKRYVTIRDWMLNTNCTQAELVPLAADSVLNLVVKQPGQNLDKVSTASVLVGAPPFLNFLTTLVTVVGSTGVPLGDFFASSLGPGKIHYGQFLLASPMFESANTGFNFAPSRDLSEAVFWNPSATAISNKQGNISLLTNLKSNAKLGGFYKINDKFSLGAGGIYARQDEFRQVTFLQGGAPRVEDSVSMKLEEYAAFFSPSYKVSDRLSVGASVKATWQQFNIPNIITVDNNQKGSYTDSSISEQHFDVDVSASFKATPSLQIGINLMNLAGAEMYSAAFVAGAVNRPRMQQRSAGLGLVYKWQRLNVGTDLLFTEDGLYDASLGVNVVPFNNALISAGLAFKQLSYSVAFRMKHFRVSFIDDNNWMPNEKRQGKSGILDGRIYGGFVFDF